MLPTELVPVPPDLVEGPRLRQLILKSAVLLRAEDEKKDEREPPPALQSTREYRMATSSSAESVPLPLASTPFTKKIEQRVLNFVRHKDALRKGEPVLVAVSGGPDSTALLRILARLRSRLGLDLTIAHFNHMLRSGAEAAADLDFVRSLASELNVPFVQGAGDVRARARHNHESPEDAARRLRYAFLAEQAALAGASCVVTGHTMDDQAETVLLHIIRGAGLDGLAGMRPRSAWPFGSGPDLARPLLCLRRNETERYCLELALKPRRDPTNESLRATRNRVRHRLMPQLVAINPRAVEAITRLARAAADDAELLDACADACFPFDSDPAPGAVSFKRGDIERLPIAIRSRMIRRALDVAAGTSEGFAGSNLDAVADLLNKPSGQLSLPHRVTAAVDSRTLRFIGGPRSASAPIEPVVVRIPGITHAGDWQFHASIGPRPDDVTDAGPLKAYLEIEKTGLDLTIRSRRLGDRLRPLGLGGEKKLQDILVDAKVPATERDGIPLVCSGDQIAWVVRHCIDERYALDRGSRQVLHLVAVRTDN